MKLIFIIANLFICIFCCSLLAYLWGPAISQYSSAFLKEAGDIIKPVSIIALAVIAGFIVLKIAAGTDR
ncbi:hypothetical protein [Candidatus Electronema sp. JM]|uniref:hypothetical protein n=1 Tax=Candidatus Electronema sp. JM TaxID=3401571 RepID=UPI003AA7FDE1